MVRRKLELLPLLADIVAKVFLRGGTQILRPAGASQHNRPKAVVLRIICLAGLYEPLTLGQNMGER
jgi:hypothetical protein